MEITGNVIGHKVQENYLVINTDTLQMRIGKTGEGAFRVQACKAGETFRETSYACPTPIAAHPMEFAELDGHFSAESGGTRIIIGKSPLRIKFETLDGQVINEDDPGLGIIWDGEEVTNYKTLQSGERFFGLGEKTGPLDRAGKQYRNWNTDAYAYGPGTDPLYVSCPFYMGLSHGHPYGIFLNNHWETTFNFGAANDRFSFFQAKGGQLDYFFFGGPNPADILREYTNLTGRIELPPLWSLGFQQCRYSYYPDTEVLRVAQTFREKNIPADVIYLDIHYMQDYKVFTWHGEKFPDPESLIKKLEALHFKVVVILDPGVKSEPGYHVYEDGMANQVFVTYPDGQPYRGAVWPGWSHFPDFTSAKVRKWWAGYVGKMADQGINGFWNDMNEPAVWGHHTPNIVGFELEGRKGTHKEAHNIYGMQMARATKEGAQKALGENRTFILTRATFSGGQRDSAVWTGDNFASDEHLLLGSRLVNSLGLSGFPFTGNDVGGFSGDAAPGLYRRWVAQAAFHPMMRAHSMINSRQAEPWSFGEEDLEVARNFIGLRYQLLPHLYSLMYEATQSGMPPVRSLVFDYFSEWKIFTAPFENQFLLGAHLMVCPVASDIAIAKVYLPKGTWYSFLNDAEYAGETEHLVEVSRDTIPIFVKAGGIIPMQSTVQYASDENDGVLRLHCYAGGNGDYTLYEDDGATHAHLKGRFAKRQIQLRGTRIEISKTEGDFSSAYKRIRVYLHGFSPKAAVANGLDLKIDTKSFRFLPSISNFDPYEDYPDEAKIISALPSVEFENHAGPVVIEIS